MVIFKPREKHHPPKRKPHLIHTHRINMKLMGGPPLYEKKNPNKPPPPPYPTHHLLFYEYKKHNTGTGKRTHGKTTHTHTHEIKEILLKKI